MFSSLINLEFLFSICIRQYADLILFSVFKEPPPCPAPSLLTTYLPGISVGGSVVSTPSPALIVCRLFDRGHLTRVRWYLLVALIWVSLRFHGVEAVHVCVCVSVCVCVCVCVLCVLNSVNKTDLLRLASGLTALISILFTGPAWVPAQ